MSSRKPGASELADELRKLADGTLCRSASPLPGPLRHVQYVFEPHSFIYCGLWSTSERQAFWLGFTERGQEIGEDFLALWEWLKDAIGAGDQEGDFGRAWNAFGHGLGDLAELAKKILVVAGIPPIMLLHPSRDEYARELRELGISLTREVIAGYEKAYDKGGIPQCTGRLLADILAIALEIVGTKGIGKAMRAVKMLPPAMKAKLNQLKGKVPSARLAVLKRRIKKALDHPDPNIQLEGRVAERYIDDVVEFQKHRYPANNPTTGAPASIPHPLKKGKELTNIEIDLELRNSIIEVTTGKKNKFGQLEKSINTLRGNPTNKQIIVFNPEFKYTDFQIKQLTDIPGVHVAQDWQELDRLVGQFGR